MHMCSMASQLNNKKRLSVYSKYAMLIAGSVESQHESICPPDLKQVSKLI